MKDKPYKRKPGDLEIRILSDGEVVILAPDEALLDVAERVGSLEYVPGIEMETDEDVAKQNSKGE